MATLKSIREALSEVMDPELHKSIMELGMVHDLELKQGVVSFTFALTTMACPMRAGMQDDARARLMALDGVKDVQITAREMTAEEKAKIFGNRAEPEGSAASVNHINSIIAVVSGKGGVGKSSAAALLAITLRQAGHTVGLLDADITGPSIPKMLLPDPGRPMGSPLGILPLETATGIKVMSINLLLADPNQAVIWRGPLISGAIKQFYGDVVWGDLDFLIVDLPPGTSDATLTVMQSIPLNGIVLVTTPQSLASMVVRKASGMAEQMNIAVLGVIENMAYFKCPDCGSEHEVFGPSHAAEMAASIGSHLLGRLPIDPRIAELADQGLLEQYDTSAFKPMVDKMLAVLPKTACGLLNEA